MPTGEPWWHLDPRPSGHSNDAICDCTRANRGRKCQGSLAQRRFRVQLSGVYYELLLLDIRPSSRPGSEACPPMSPVTSSAGAGVESRKR